jgi:hypothetical protein
LIGVVKSSANESKSSFGASYRVQPGFNQRVIEPFVVSKKLYERVEQPYRGAKLYVSNSSIGMLTSAVSLSTEFLYLCVEGKLIEFELFVELAGDATSFEDKRLHFSIEHDRVPDVFLQLTGTVVDVQVGIPVIRPINLFNVLVNDANT